MKWQFLTGLVGILLLAAAVVTSYAACWDKPYNFWMLSYLPWYTWVFYAVGSACYFLSCWDSLWNFFRIRRLRNELPAPDRTGRYK